MAQARADSGTKVSMSCARLASRRKGSSPTRRMAETGLPFVRRDRSSSWETRGMRRVSLLRFWRRGKHAPTEEKNRKRLNTEVTEIGHRGHGDVLVQPEMERWRFPLASIPPFGRGFSRHRYDHQAIPQHGCVPAEPASVSPGKIIVAPPCPSVSTSGYPIRPNDPARELT